MTVPKPFLPLYTEKEGLLHKVTMTNRTVTFGADSLPISMTAEGHELLSAPVRIVGMEDGKEIVWDDNYPENESEAFLQSHNEEETVLCGAKRSENLIIDTCVRTSFDGNINFDVKLMPNGFTVAEVFGMKDKPVRRCYVERLWLEIPLRREAVELYSFSPSTDIYLADGNKVARTATSYAGVLPKQDCYLPFKCLLWLGKDTFGCGFSCESDQYWQPADPNHTLEILQGEDTVTLRVRLLDSHPKSWKEDPANARYAYAPLSFRFGLCATPVKPFPAQPFMHNAMHIDCFIKTPGNYWDYMTAEKDGKNRFDRLVEKGVTTLILHEKWNKSQNTFEISEVTGDMITKIVHECHKRGIKVLTYFGYEIATMNELWSEKSADTLSLLPNGKQQGGWYRVPYQRDYVVCYQNQEWADRFVNGIAKIMDTYHTDGVYLDSTANPFICANLRHGCGYVDEDGKLHGTYPMLSTNAMLKRLYEEVHKRGGYVNVHVFGAMNFLALPYIDITWCGEDLQFGYTHGDMTKFPLEHFRACYTGRNTGVPMELLAYENRPIWNFEDAISMALLHGILPRPNDIEGPLDCIAPVWKIFNTFPIEHSEFCGYWDNGATVSDDRVKVSYYRYKDLYECTHLLAFVANTEPTPVEKCSVELKEAVTVCRDLAIGENVSLNNLSLKPFGYRIFCLK